MVVLTDNPDAQASACAVRTLHLIDLENLVGSGHLSCEQVRDAHALYRNLVGVSPGDLVVLATSHHNAKAGWFGWAGNPRRLVRSGRDGADLALLEVIEREAPADRFERVVICSGDGIFADAAAGLAGAGVTVTVASRDGHLARRLSLAASEVRLLPGERSAAIAA